MTTPKPDLTSSSAGDRNRPLSALFVCRTCARDVQLSPGDRSKGAELAERICNRLQNSRLACELHLRIVTCLNGCPNPCNVAFRGPGKVAFRFSGVAPGDEDAVLAFASEYVSSAQGDVPAEILPRNLRTKLRSRVAPPMA